MYSIKIIDFIFNNNNAILNYKIIYYLKNNKIINYLYIIELNKINKYNLNNNFYD